MKEWKSNLRVCFLIFEEISCEECCLSDNSMMSIGSLEFNAEFVLWIVSIKFDFVDVFWVWAIGEDWIGLAMNKRSKWLALHRWKWRGRGIALNVFCLFWISDRQKTHFEIHILANGVTLPCRQWRHCEPTNYNTSTTVNSCRTWTESWIIRLSFMEQCKGKFQNGTSFWDRWIEKNS